MLATRGHNRHNDGRNNPWLSMGVHVSEIGRHVTVSECAPPRPSNTGGHGNVHILPPNGGGWVNQ
mgnify:CR=1 FL=1